METYTLNAATLQNVCAFTLNDAVHIPDSALDRAALLLLDTLGIAAGSVALEAGQYARDFAVDFMAAGKPEYQAPLLFDGRLVSLPGAAFALATQIDNLDGHDGYNPTKGHIGCAVVPALFAFACQRPALSGRDALRAMVVAYEVAARAAIALHASVSDYHTSGAWNALGVAALGCRLRNAPQQVLRAALGIAEYHGPRSQMMREIAFPTMLHDGSGMGALVGVKSVLLAERGFRGAPAITVEAEAVAPTWEDLGSVWTIEKNYIKPYPVCRWAHAALDAIKSLVQRYKIGPDAIQTVEIRTFHEAACLYSGMPETTSQAQYSLPFAAASLLRFGYLGAEQVSGSALSDPLTAALVRKIQVVADARHSERFPAGRWADVTFVLENGQRLKSGDVHAHGGPEAPLSHEQIVDKFRCFAEPVLGHVRAERLIGKILGLADDGSSLAELAAALNAVP